MFSDEGLARLVELMDGELKVPSLTVDQDRRWGILTALARNGQRGALARAEAELERDDSARARRSMVRIHSIYPDAETKSTYLDDLFDPESKTSFADHRTAARVLFVEGQEKLHEQFADRIVAHIAATESEADPEYFMRAQLIARFLPPGTCSNASVERLSRMVAAHQESRESVLRPITERWEDDVRCVARIKALESAGPAQP